VAGRTCTLDGTSSTDDVKIIDYAWTWPSGQILSYASKFTRLFGGSGPRTVLLTVWDNKGVKNQIQVDFTVLP
jgi:hypothetical protein